MSERQAPESDANIIEFPEQKLRPKGLVKAPRVPVRSTSPAPFDVKSSGSRRNIRLVVGDQDDDDGAILFHPTPDVQGDVWDQLSAMLDEINGRAVQLAEKSRASLAQLRGPILRLQEVSSEEGEDEEGSYPSSQYLDPDGDEDENYTSSQYLDPEEDR